MKNSLWFGGYFLLVSWLDYLSVVSDGMAMRSFRMKPRMPPTSGAAAKARSAQEIGRVSVLAKAWRATARAGFRAKALPPM